MEIKEKTKGVLKLMKGVDCMKNKILLVEHAHDASSGTHCLTGLFLKVKHKQPTRTGDGRGRGVQKAATFHPFFHLIFFANHCLAVFAKDLFPYYLIL